MCFAYTCAKANAPPGAARRVLLLKYVFQVVVEAARALPAGLKGTHSEKWAFEDENLEASLDEFSCPLSLPEGR